ncbi:DUF397 domain-containing protein [Kitasatospora aureofaciens]|uniref:DUF397 domain-containing protein n=1 Tax=Kitasatospora aureofaciens TaxID=1894 RepID=UPI001D286775|nr:DUF397 domain-containing protein [Kitasatospora aureofaciens]HJD80525.1 DUF397 domain-containing protein [Kitasatospora aureofaciens]
MNQELQIANWRKSTYSNGQGDCVEFGQLVNAVAVRDSKDRHGPALSFTSEAWQSFIAGIRSDDFPTNR